jgi:hypothetical protein
MEHVRFGMSDLLAGSARAGVVTATPGPPIVGVVVGEPFTAAAARLSGVEEAILREAADRFDIIAKESVARVIGGGSVMLLHTRRGRRPVPMKTKATMGHSVLFIEGTPRAQWTWIEEGTKPHRIPKGRRKTFLKGPSYAHPIRGPIMHHGSRGARAWTRAVDTFRGEYPDIVTTQVKKALNV